MFWRMKTDNVALQLSEKRMTKTGIRQGKIQTLMGFKQNLILLAAEFVENASLAPNCGPPDGKSNGVPSMKSHILGCVCLAAALCLPALTSSSAADVKVLTAGAFKQVVLALVPDFEKQTGNKVIVDNDTAGGLQKRIESGEAFDVAIITPTIVEDTDFHPTHTQFLQTPVEVTEGKDWSTWDTTKPADWSKVMHHGDASK